MLQPKDLREQLITYLFNIRNDYLCKCIAEIYNLLVHIKKVSEIFSNFIFNDLKIFLEIEVNIENIFRSIFCTEILFNYYIERMLIIIKSVKHNNKTLSEIMTALENERENLLRYGNENLSGIVEKNDYTIDKDSNLISIHHSAVENGDPRYIGYDYKMVEGLLLDMQQFFYMNLKTNEVTNKIDLIKKGDFSFQNKGVDYSQCCLNIFCDSNYEDDNIEEFIKSEAYNKISQQINNDITNELLNHAKNMQKVDSSSFSKNISRDIIYELNKQINNNVGNNNVSKNSIATNNSKSSNMATYGDAICPSGLVSTQHIHNNQVNHPNMLVNNFGIENSTNNSNIGGSIVLSEMTHEENCPCSKGNSNSNFNKIKNKKGGKKRRKNKKEYNESNSNNKNDKNDKNECNCYLNTEDKKANSTGNSNVFNINSISAKANGIIEKCLSISNKKLVNMHDEINNVFKKNIINSSSNTNAKMSNNFLSTLMTKSNNSNTNEISEFNVRNSTNNNNNNNINSDTNMTDLAYEHNTSHNTITANNNDYNNNNITINSNLSNLNNNSNGNINNNNITNNTNNSNTSNKQKILKNKIFLRDDNSENIHTNFPFGTRQTQLFIPNSEKCSLSLVKKGSNIKRNNNSNKINSKIPKSNQQMQQEIKNKDIDELLEYITAEDSSKKKKKKQNNQNKEKNIVNSNSNSSNINYINNNINSNLDNTNNTLTIVNEIKSNSKKKKNEDSNEDDYNKNLVHSNPSHNNNNCEENDFEVNIEEFRKMICCNTINSRLIDKITIN